MVASMTGTAYFSYKYVTSENFKAKIMNQIFADVQQKMPKMLNNKIPKSTGISIPKSP